MNPLPARRQRLSTLALLQRLLGAFFLSLLVFWFTLYQGTGLFRTSLQHLDRDAGSGSPQAQNLRVILADMDTSVVRQLLLSPEEQQGTIALTERTRYTTLHARFSAHLTRALERLVSGGTDDKHARAALAHLQNDLGAYDALTARALTLHDWDDGARTQSEAFVAYRQAQRQHAALLATADELSQARKMAFEDADRFQNDTRDLTVLGFKMVALLLFAILVAAQVALFLRTRRMLNVGLVAATLLSLVLLWWASSVFGLTGDQIARAQDERYRLLDLGRMRALAHLARGSEGRLLLLARDNATRERETAVFRQKMADFPHLVAVSTPSGSEIRREWSRYQRAHNKLLVQLQSGQRAAALDSYLQAAGRDSRIPYDAFERAISSELAATQSDLDTALTEGTTLLRYHELLASLLVLAIALVVVRGVAPRFKEYISP